MASTTNQYPGPVTTTGFVMDQYSLDESTTVITFNIYNESLSVSRADCELQYEKTINLRNRLIKVNAVCHICSLYTHPDHRNKGNASVLLKTIIHFCEQNMVRLITLDDCSDNYRKPDNIYREHGFEYLNDGDNLMIYPIEYV
jgi:GNAT superfamily N-acetyltransferase